MKYAVHVMTSDGKLRYFPTFEAAERWSRRFVAESGKSEFSERAVIYSEEACLAEVCLDGADRVWTDMK